MSTEHNIIVILDAKPGKEEELRQALDAVVEPSREEDTCLSYHLYENDGQPGQFILSEKWISKDAHAKQFEKPYIQELAACLDDLLEKPCQMIIGRELRTEQEVV